MEQLEIRMDLSISNDLKPLADGRPSHRQCVADPGRNGVTKDLPLDRFWRDARVERICEGTSDLHRDIICKDVLREFSA